MSGSKENDEHFLIISGRLIDSLKDEFKNINWEEVDDYCFIDFRNKMSRLASEMSKFSLFCNTQLHIKLLALWIRGDLYGLHRMIKNIENPTIQYKGNIDLNDIKLNRRKMWWISNKCKAARADLSNIYNKFDDILEHFKELDILITNHGRWQDYNPKNNEILEIFKKNNVELVLCNWIKNLYCYLRKMLKFKLPEYCLEERYYSDNLDLKMSISSDKKTSLISKALEKLNFKYEDYIILKAVYRGLVRINDNIVNKPIEDKYEIKPNSNSLPNFSSNQLKILKNLADFNYSIYHLYAMDNWKSKAYERENHEKKLKTYQKKRKKTKCRLKMGNSENCSKKRKRNNDN